MLMVVSVRDICTRSNTTKYSHLKIVSNTLSLTPVSIARVNASIPSNPLPVSSSSSLVSSPPLSTSSANCRLLQDNQNDKIFYTTPLYYILTCFPC